MLSVENVSFNYNDSATVDAVSFSVKKGGVMAVVGESGSGKSTLLKLIYGHLDVCLGSISWKDQPILGPKNKLVAGHGFMKYVAQEFDLMPYITVAENIGAHLSNFYPKEKQMRTEELLAVVGLRAYSNTAVQFLSGGQKQRVALAKALAKQPEIILLDEPFSHIDSFKKRPLRRRIFNYLKSNEIACVLATHDKDDVLSFAEQMLVLHKGKVLSSGRPKDLYNKPEHPIIAAFFAEYSSIDGVIYYAHQIKLVAKGDLKANVVKSYLKEGFYLVEATYKEQRVFLNHVDFVPSGTSVWLSFDSND